LLIMRVVWFLTQLAGSLVLGMFRLNRTQYPYIQNYLYEHALEPAEKLGGAYEQGVRILTTSASKS